MIVGFQVKNAAGQLWADRHPNSVLSEVTAISDLKASKMQSEDDTYFIVAILQGDIVNPVCENPLAVSIDTYRALGISIEHLQSEDKAILERLSNDNGCNMVLSRDTGWFIKLYEENEYNLSHKGLSKTLGNVISAAFTAGYRLIEIDIGGTVHNSLPTF